jgi:2-polyprenyl-3-methyl-5-hydroxy-6-metoxy-1,4-benzoquinol methylase
MNAIEVEQDTSAEGSKGSSWHCPLCAGTVADEVERISYDKIWSALADEHRAIFSEDVIYRHTSGQEAVLVECHECGLQYFAAALPGDDQFYRELTSTSDRYYNQDKWDFLEAGKVISPKDCVLDIACGSGNFLKIVEAKGCDAVGIDTNPAAVSEACANGLSAYCVDLATYAVGHARRFDVVTAFQVIEHITEVQPFVRSALTCLKPGGKLILTVPNRRRRFRDDFEPLDSPPHHLSRWASAQFTTLAEAFGCRVVDIRFEPMSMHDCRRFLRNRITGGGQLSESIWARAIARLVFTPSLYSMYARQGWLDRWRLWHMSVMCVLAKPGA